MQVRWYNFVVMTAMVLSLVLTGIDSATLLLDVTPFTGTPGSA